MSEPALVAFVPDLMDRSRLAGVSPTFASSLPELVGLVSTTGPAACTVVMDLSRPGALDTAVDLAARGARVVGFAPHVDDELRTRAAAGGVQVVARSRFFAGPAQVLGNPNVQPPSR
jgi:hypothetical protein